MEIKLKARAKINFFLDITGLKDGYHTIDTIMGSVELFDTLSVKTRKDKKINVFCQGVQSENNTALKAAKLFMQKFDTAGADIEICKGIPFCSGLGGSSADAAAVIYALMNFYNVKKQDVYDICLNCGSDTPYMLQGGLARAQGRGEMLTRFESGQAYNLVIAKPKGGVNTKDAYAMYDRLNGADGWGQADYAEKIMLALKTGDNKGISKYCYNALYKASAALLHDINVVLRKIKNSGADAAFMSGSGSACAGIFSNIDKAEECAMLLKKQGYFAAALKTAEKGIDII